MTMSAGLGIFSNCGLHVGFSLTVLTNKLYGIIQVQEALIYFVFVKGLYHIVNKTSSNPQTGAPCSYAMDSYFVPLE